MNDQSIKADAGKARVDLVPQGIVWAVARVREYGLKKYPGGEEKWRAVEIWRYRAAAYRHLLRYLKEPAGKDSESGLPHLWHLACNVAFLVELEEEKGDPWELMAERAAKEKNSAEGAKDNRAAWVASIIEQMKRTTNGEPCSSCKYEKTPLTEEPCFSRCEVRGPLDFSAYEPKEAEVLKTQDGDIYATVDCGWTQPQK